MYSILFDLIPFFLFSLVDVRSTKDNIIEHWHRLVDCKNDALLAKWAITKRMDSHTGLVTFGNMGIVKTLEKEKVREVRDRIIARKEEQGICVRNNKWECTQIENSAEQQCKEVSHLSAVTTPINVNNSVADKHFPPQAVFRGVPA